MTNNPDFWLTLARGDAPAARFPESSVDEDLLLSLAGLSERTDATALPTARRGPEQSPHTRFLRNLAGLHDSDFLPQPEPPLLDERPAEAAASSECIPPPTRLSTAVTTESRRTVGTQTFRVVIALTVIGAALAVGFVAGVLWNKLAQDDDSSKRKLQGGPHVVRSGTATGEQMAVLRPVGRILVTRRCQMTSVISPAKRFIVVSQATFSCKRHSVRWARARSISIRLEYLKQSILYHRDFSMTDDILSIEEFQATVRQRYATPQI